jgi:hypothetical protein
VTWFFECLTEGGKDVKISKFEWRCFLNAWQKGERVEKYSKLGDVVFWMPDRGGKGWKNTQNWVTSFLNAWQKGERM